MGGGGTTTSEQKVTLTPEAQQLMAQELALFGNAFLPAEMGARGDALTGLGPRFAGTTGAKGTDSALAMARNATQQAGKQAGVAPKALTGALGDLDVSRPETMGNMQNVFRQMAMSQGGMMDPRFAQFLKPEVETSSDFEPSAGAKAAQAASMAIAVAAVAATVIAI